MSWRRGVSPGSVHPRGVGAYVPHVRGELLVPREAPALGFQVHCDLFVPHQALRDLLVCGVLTSAFPRVHVEALPTLLQERAPEGAARLRKRAERVRAGVACGFHGGVVRAVDAGQADDREVGEDFEERFNREVEQATWREGCAPKWMWGALLELLGIGRRHGAGWRNTGAVETLI